MMVLMVLICILLLLVMAEVVLVFIVQQMHALVDTFIIHKILEHLIK